MPEPAARQAYRSVVVNITPGNPPKVDLDPVEVSKSRKDEVVWECEGDPNFEVIFETDSPFNDDHFKKGKNQSGPAKGNAKEKPHVYKYTVTAGGGTLDPGTIVNP